MECIKDMRVVYSFAPNNDVSFNDGSEVKWSEVKWSEGKGGGKTRLYGKSLYE